jgi:NADPH:quinone reductase-like Zn-dependent oxidoreductase
VRAILLRHSGPPESLAVEEHPEPTPVHGQVLIQVCAAGVNFADVLARQGIYPGAPPRPFIPGYESSGEVVALGPGVEGIRVGDRVLAFHLGGGYAERIAVPASQVISIPDGMSFQSAVVLPLHYGTAHIALYRTGPVEPGMRIFIHAAAGGVGLAAVDLARAAGLEITGGASTHFKRERLLAEGVKHVVPSFRLRVDKESRRFYGGPAYDIVLDSVGGSGIRRGVRALRPGGRLVTLGVGAISRRGWLGARIFALRSPRISYLDLLRDSRAIHGVNLPTFLRDQALVRGILESLVGAASRGAIHPEPGRVLALEEAWLAHQLLETRRNVGKIVLRT